jgi:hypothetical protein
VSLGDAYAGETRRMLAAINLRPLPDHSEYDVATLDVRWTSVLGPTAQQSVVLPVRVTAAAIDEVHQAAADPRVMEQLGVLRAADLERAARLAADRGEFDDAARMLREGAEHLRFIGRPDLATDLETSAVELSRGTWDQAAAKRLYSRAREKNRGRRSTYETSWDPMSGPSGPGSSDPGVGPGITPPPTDPGPLGSDPT